MELRFNLDSQAFRAQMKRLADRDVKIAVTWALNDTAKDVEKHLGERMQVVFDRPTAFTKRAFGVLQGARPNRLTVEVGEKTAIGRRHFLKVQEAGGPRPQTAFERRLAPLMGNASVAAVPTKNARMNAFGNWSVGERNQVSAQLQIGHDVGYTSNETEASKKKKRKTRARYFVPRHGLPPGVYRRDKPGGDPIKILSFSKTAPTYQKRLGFSEEAEREFWAKLPAHMDRALAKMIAKRS